MKAIIASGSAVFIAAVMALLVGWFSNLWFLINTAINYDAAVTSLARLCVSALGVIVFPIGALHGVISWFI
jgi:hypothetical protein